MNRNPLDGQTRDLRRGGANLGIHAEPESESSEDPMIGQSLGNYQIESILGRGGMGKVYRALQTHPVRRAVALKILNLGVGGQASSSQQDAKRRFVAEGQLLALLNHPEIASVYDADTTDRGEPYFVMELVEGLPLTSFCRENRLTITDRIRLIQRICRVVHSAHQKGVVHRDLKPDNILVTHGDDGPLLKIIDFGIAKVIDGHDNIAAGLTCHDAFLGTPGYLSPEQASGSDVDARADVYSIGTMLFELLCGSTPINPNDTPFEDFASLRHLTTTYQPQRPSVRIRASDRLTQRQRAEECDTDLTHLIRQCCSDLDWVVLKAIDPDRIKRYATAIDFADDLQRILDGHPTHAAAPTYLYRTRKFVQRNPSASIAATWLLVLAAGGLVWWQSVQHERMVQTTIIAHQSTSLMDQVTTMRKTIRTSDHPPNSQLVRAAVKLSQAKRLIDPEPTLVQARTRLRLLESSLDTDESEFDFVSALATARHLSTFPQQSQGEQTMERESLNSLAVAFTDFGLVPDQVSPESAAGRLQDLPHVLKPEVIESLDFWIGELLANATSTAARWQHDLVVCLDPDPSRNRLRSAIFDGDTAELELIARQGLDHGYLPFSRVQLASALAVAGRHPHSLEVLRRAQRAHPDDFWVNHHLAISLARRPGEASKQEALRFFTAAAAIRPELAGPAMNLAHALKALGRDDEARAQEARAQALSSKVTSLGCNRRPARKLGTSHLSLVICQ